MTELRPSEAPTIWSAFDGDFLRRVRTSSITFGLVLSVPLAMSFGWMAGLAWVAGGAWSLANLAATTSVVRNVVTLEARDKVAIAKSLAIKFPALYAIGLGILASGIPAVWVLAGFAWPLFVAVMKALGRSYLRLDSAA